MGSADEFAEVSPVLTNVRPANYIESLHPKKRKKVSHKNSRINLQNLTRVPAGLVNYATNDGFSPKRHTESGLKKSSSRNTYQRSKKMIRHEAGNSIDKVYNRNMKFIMTQDGIAHVRNSKKFLSPMGQNLPLMFSENNSIDAN